MDVCFPSPVNEELGGQSFRPRFAEYHIVGFEGFEVDARRQGGMHALGQALGDFYPSRNHLVLCVAGNRLENSKQK